MKNLSQQNIRRMQALASLGERRPLIFSQPSKDVEDYRHTLTHSRQSLRVGRNHQDFPLVRISIRDQMGEAGVL